MIEVDLKMICIHIALGFHWLQSHGWRQEWCETNLDVFDVCTDGSAPYEVGNIYSSKQPKIKKEYKVLKTQLKRQMSVMCSYVISRNYVAYGAKSCSMCGIQDSML